MSNRPKINHRPVDDSIDKNNSRRQAIQAQRARKAANAG